MWQNCTPQHKVNIINLDNRTSESIRCSSQRCDHTFCMPFSPALSLSPSNSLFHSLTPRADVASGRRKRTFGRGSERKHTIFSRLSMSCEKSIKHLKFPSIFILLCQLRSLESISTHTYVRSMRSNLTSNRLSSSVGRWQKKKTMETQIHALECVETAAQVPHTIRGWLYVSIIFPCGLFCFRSRMCVCVCVCSTLIGTRSV